MVVRGARSAFLLSAVVLGLSGVWTNSVAAISKTSARVQSTAVNKEQFAYNFCKVLQVQPTVGGASPFQDVSTSAAEWPYVHRAVDMGFLAPDSPGVYGSTDLMTVQAASSAIADYFGAREVGASAVTWAVQHKILSASPTSTGLTLATELSMLERARQLGLAAAPVVPVSWKLSPSQAEVLREALFANFVDGSTTDDLTMTLRRHLNTTALGAKDPNVVQLADQNDGTVKVETKGSLGYVKNQPTGLSSVTTTQTNSDGKASATTVYKEFFEGQSLFTDNGYGWQRTQSTTGAASVVVSDLGSLAFVPADLGGVTLTSHQDGTYTFASGLSAQGVQMMVQQIISGFGASNADATTSAIVQKNLHVALTVTAQQVFGEYNITGISLHMQLVLPFSLLAALGGAPSAGSSQLPNEITSLLIDQTIGGTFGFTRRPIAVPMSLWGTVAH